uniref:Uncharacterized protein n=1 Tax=Arundo donax TaxID=35708 RepID=A0A0A9C7B5_ARUDO
MVKVYSPQVYKISDLLFKLVLLDVNQPSFQRANPMIYLI